VEFEALEQPSQRVSSTKRMRQWFRHSLGVDRAIFFTILARVWSSTAGLITVSLIARYLSPAEQGYYYTFGSLVALQIVFELGFSLVILQMASHERAHLTISPDYEISGDPIAHARLASVLQKSVRWYSTAAVFMAALLLPAGLYFFSAHQHPGPAISWRLPWCLAALAATAAFQLDPILSFLEGCGFVHNVARLRLAQAFSGSVLAWGVLVLHHGLLAPAMMIFGTASTSGIWLFGKRRMLLGLMRYMPGANRIVWRAEVWPFQWKIAVSWFCGYFIFQLFNPVLFAYWGPVAAGQMGMSLSAAGAVQAVAISWISTKCAPFGTLIARKKYTELDHVFFRSMRQAISVSAVGGLVFWLGCVYLNMEHFKFAQRLLSPFSFGLLLLATLINVVVYAEATYLRAHKQEKFLIPTIVGTILFVPTTYVLGRFFGARGMVAGNLAIGICWGLTSANYVFLKYRKLWHSQ
jgi:hypothetical protein